MNRVKFSQQKKELIKTIFFFLLLTLVPIFFVTLPRVVLPLMTSFFLYLMVRPFVPYLLKIGLSKNFTYSVLVLILVLVISYPVVNMIPAIVKESDRVQEHIINAERFLSEGYLSLKVKVKDLSGHELDDNFVKNYIGQAKEFVTGFIIKLPKVLASALEWILLIPLFVFFLLKDGKLFSKLALRMAPNHLFERIFYLSHQFNKQLGDYIFAKTIEASILCVIITTGLLILGVDYPIFLGLISGATNIVPYLGPILGIVPALIVTGSQFGLGNELWLVTFLYLGANVVDLAIVFPILVSKIVNLHPVVVVVSVILGSQYMGVAGMIISIPAAAALKLITVEIYKDLYINRSN